MARRRGKRKRPQREDFMLKEQKKVESMLDKSTMIYLSKFYNKGIIDKLGFIMARGKESDIYIASAGDADELMDEKYVILKFFRIETSTFFNMSDYIIGDPRFKDIAKSKTELVNIWCKKEFGNLQIAVKAGVHAPKPYMFNGNILAMQYLGDENGQAMQLKEVDLDEKGAENILDMVIDDMRKLYKAKLVHGDISEYNILVKDGVAYIIDFGQGVVLRHPNAIRFLKRDIVNVLTYFKKRYEIDRSREETLKFITSE